MITVKFIIKNISHYKSKITPIILSIILCIIMMIFCFSYINISKLNKINKLNSEYQSLDLLAYSTKEFSDEQKLELNKYGYDNISYFSIIQSKLEKDNKYNNVNVQVIDYLTYKKLKKIDTYENNSQGVIIKDYVANKNNLKVGDYIKVYINNNLYQFNISKIVLSADITNYFYGDILIDKREIAAQDIDINSIWINNGIALNLDRDTNIVDEVINDSKLKELLFINKAAAYEDDLSDDGYFIIAMYTILAIGIISVFSIVKNSYNNFLEETLREITTLKCLGISTFGEKFIWYLQTIIITLFSCFIGTVVAWIVTNILINIIFENQGIIMISIKSLVISIAVILISNLLITFKIINEVSRINVIRLFKQTSNKAEIGYSSMLKNIIRIIIMSLCVVAIKIILNYVNNKWLYISLCIADIVIFSIIVGNIITISINSIINKEKNLIQKSLHISFSQIYNMVIAMILSIMLLIGLLGVFDNISITFMNNLKETINYDFNVYLDNSNIKRESIDELLKNVSDYSMVDEKNGYLNKINVSCQGINPNDIKDFYNLSYDKDIDTIISSFKEGENNIIISERVANKLGISNGDKVDLEVDNKISKAIVVGICNSLGYYVYTNNTTEQYNRILVKAPNLTVEDIISDIGSFYNDYQVMSTESILKSEKDHIEENLKSFLSMAIVIFILALTIMLNTLKMSIYKHKLDIAVLNTLGIAKISMFNTIFKKGFIYIFMSIIGGVLVSNEFIYMSSDLMGKILFIKIIQRVDLEKCILIAFALLLVMIMCSIILEIYILHYNKKSLVEYIKE